MIRYLLAMLSVTTPAFAQNTGLEVWSKIYEVFSHPRCANCHVGSNSVPMWSGPSYGPRPRPHGMNINAGASRKGAEYVACSACHTRHNSQVPHGPPGALPWQLPPVSMQWFGKSSADICAQIKDPTRNGDRTIANVAEHVQDDALVHWGWAPGPGRESAPYSAVQLVQFVKQWDAAGAPCPTK